MSEPQPPAKRIKWRRIAALSFLTVLVFLLMRTVSDPWGDEEYLEVSHGNHAHFIPKDKDPDVSISNFPTQRPAPNQRILPDGRVVNR